MGTAMGEVIELDERGRLTIPLQFRRILRGSRVRVERGDDNTILIRADFDSEAVLRHMRAIRLRGDKRRAKYDASSARDRYGGVKD